MHEIAPQYSAALNYRKGRKWPDISFKYLAMVGALMIVLLIVLVGYELYRSSSLSVHQFGFSFVKNLAWDPAADIYGALPFIYGTLVSSLLALLIAIPLGVAAALFLTEVAPLSIRQPIITIIELLASVPSVIYGLWGIFVLIPWMRDSFSREVLRAVPDLQREAAYALGATHWEVIRIAVLSYAKRGLFGAGVLGLGRALGETMAVTMVIGNSPVISASLFAPGYTLASVIANEFAEATTDLYMSSLFELGLVLLVITLIVNAIAQLMLRQLTNGASAKN